jgi:hypothetical protein
VNQTKSHGINRGFRVKNDNMFTYVQEKKGLNYLYCKRPVCKDGVTTLPTHL